jgi:hypothetical protein
MRKLLFGFAALAAAALMVLAAWAVTALLAGALTLPRWALIAMVVAVFAGSGLTRWRKGARIRRRGKATRRASPDVRHRVRPGGRA